MGEMQMSEMARLIEALRSAGWSEKKINDFLIYIETGNEEYRPGVDYIFKNEVGNMHDMCMFPFFVQ